MKKIAGKHSYKGFGIFQLTMEYAKANNMELFQIYTPDEMAQPANVRYVEWEASSLEEAKAFIDSY